MIPYELENISLQDQLDEAKAARDEIRERLQEAYTEAKARDISVDAQFEDFRIQLQQQLTSFEAAVAQMGSRVSDTEAASERLAREHRGAVLDQREVATKVSRLSAENARLLAAVKAAEARFGAPEVAGAKRLGPPKSTGDAGLRRFALAKVSWLGFLFFLSTLRLLYLCHSPPHPQFRLSPRNRRETHSGRELRQMTASRDILFAAHSYMPQQGPSSSTSSIDDLRAKNHASKPPSRQLLRSSPRRSRRPPTSRSALIGPPST